MAQQRLHLRHIGQGYSYALTERGNSNGRSLTAQTSGVGESGNEPWVLKNFRGMPRKKSVLEHSRRWLVLPWMMVRFGGGEPGHGVLLQSEIVVFFKSITTGCCVHFPLEHLLIFHPVQSCSEVPL